MSIILVGSFFICGCQSSDTDTESHYDRVSRQIEQLKAQSEAQVQTESAAGVNIKIKVNMLTVSKTDYSAIDSLWRYVNRHFAVSRLPEILDESGLVIGLSTAGFKARLQVVREKLKYSEESELFLLVADGSSGYINVGTTITVPRFFYFGRWYNAVDYDFRQAGRSLKITARRLPVNGLINLKITPVFSRFLNDGGDMEFTEAATHITVRAGQPVVIGGFADSKENIAKALLGYEAEMEEKGTLIIITPYIQ